MATSGITILASKAAELHRALMLVLPSREDRRSGTAALWAL
jgi:hypothetical protein